VLFNWANQVAHLAMNQPDSRPQFQLFRDFVLAAFVTITAAVSMIGTTSAQPYQYLCAIQACCFPDQLS
jgi:hypothetical protein